MTSQTAQVKNGKLILPKKLRKSWNGDKVFVFSSPDTILVKKQREPVKKISKAAKRINLPKLTLSEIQKEIESYRKG